MMIGGYGDKYILSMNSSTQGMKTVPRMCACTHAVCIYDMHISIPALIYMAGYGVLQGRYSSKHEIRNVMGYMQVFVVLKYILLQLVTQIIGMKLKTQSETMKKY